MLEENAQNELHTQIQYRLVEKLTESERRHRELVENLREIVFECDEQGQFTFINRAWTETLGYSVQASVGQPLASFISGADVDEWQMLRSRQADCSAELRFCHQNGDIRWLELSMRFRRDGNVLGSLIDVTTRKQAAMILKQTNEELEDRVQQRTSELIQANQELANALQKLKQAQGRLIQQEKMSGLGQLVAGVAHEINNPVNYIYGNIPHIQTYVQALLGLLHQYEQEYPQPSARIQSATQNIDFTFIREDLPRTLDSVRMGGDRISEIVKSLRSFSRLDEAEIKPVDIHNGLDDTLVILNHRLRACGDRAEIQVVKDYGALPLVECYAGLLNQVFMNLLTNAIDALEDQKRRPLHPANGVPQPGQITLITQQINPQRVQIEISDNGPGISSQLQQRIFEPFFTTKQIGQGTGMGLSISHQIVTEQHGGTLECVSMPGKGTQFIIQIPLQQSAAKGL